MADDYSWLTDEVLARFYSFKRQLFPEGASWDKPVTLMGHTIPGLELLTRYRAWKAKQGRPWLAAAWEAYKEGHLDQMRGNIVSFGIRCQDGTYKRCEVPWDEVDRAIGIKRNERGWIIGQDPKEQKYVRRCECGEPTDPDYSHCGKCGGWYGRREEVIASLKKESRDRAKPVAMIGSPLDIVGRCAQCGTSLCQSNYGLCTWCGTVQDDYKPRDFSQWKQDPFAFTLACRKCGEVVEGVEFYKPGFVHECPPARDIYEREYKCVFSDPGKFDDFPEEHSVTRKEYEHIRLRDFFFDNDRAHQHCIAHEQARRDKRDKEQREWEAWVAEHDTPTLSASTINAWLASGEIDFIENNPLWSAAMNSYKKFRSATQPEPNDE